MIHQFYENCFSFVIHMDYDFELKEMVGHGNHDFTHLSLRGKMDPVHMARLLYSMSV